MTITKTLIAAVTAAAYADLDLSAKKHPTAPAFQSGYACIDGLSLSLKYVGTKKSMRGALRDVWKLEGKRIAKAEILAASK